jgi:hypothetical protein
MIGICQSCRCSSCSALVLTHFVADASARRAIGAGSTAGDIAHAFVVLALLIVLGVPLTSGEAPILLLFLFAVLLLLLIVLLGRVALEPGVAWYCSSRS